jgi:hypothetical protein
MKFERRGKFAPPFLLNLILCRFLAAFWQNLHKFNGKFAAVKFAVLFD